MFDFDHTEFQEKRKEEETVSIGFRAILIMISILTLSYILKKIRDAKLEIEHALFWLGFAGIIFILSIFPSCVYWLTDLLEIQSPVNFVFLAIIFILIIKDFSTTLQLSKLENKVKNLTQEIALREKEKEEKHEEKR